MQNQQAFDSNKEILVTNPDEYNENNLLIMNKFFSTNLNDKTMTKSFKSRQKNSKSMYQNPLIPTNHEETIKPSKGARVRSLFKSAQRIMFLGTSQAKAPIDDNPYVEIPTKSQRSRRESKLKKIIDEDNSELINEANAVSILHTFRSNFEDNLYRISSKSFKEGSKINTDLPINDNQLNMIADKLLIETNHHHKHFQSSTKNKNNEYEEKRYGESENSKELRKTLRFSVYHHEKKTKKGSVFNKLKKSSYLFSPNTTYKISWDLFCIALIIYELIVTPFFLSFDPPYNIGLVDMEFIVTAVFIMDILISMNTGYFDHGILIMNRKQILINYFKLWFWIDVLSTFPYSWLEVNPLDEDMHMNNKGKNAAGLMKLVKIMRTLRVLNLSRVFKLRRMMNKIEVYLNMSGSAIIIIGFLKLGLTILCIAHWIACSFHYLGYSEIDDSEKTWLTAIESFDKDLLNRYVVSIYWATTTIITIGYGDIVPITVEEKIFSMLIMLIGCVLFAFVVSKINELFLKLDYDTKTCRIKIAEIRAYLKKKRITYELRSRIQQCVEFMIAYANEHDQDQQTLSILSDNLKNELMIEVHNRSILKAKTITSNFSKKIIEGLYSIIYERNYTIDEDIFNENENNHDNALYIIKTGVVLIYAANTNTPLKKIESFVYEMAFIYNNNNHYHIVLYSQKGSFGEIGFFTGMKRIASAKSKDFSTILFIKRSDFLNLLENYPADKEKFYQIKDNILFNQNYGDVNILCYSCYLRGHTIMNCPSMHYEPDRRSVIKQYEHKVIKIKEKLTNFCVNFKRPSRPKIHKCWSYENQKKIVQKLRNIHEDEEKLVDSKRDSYLEENDFYFSERRGCKFSKPAINHYLTNKFIRFHAQITQGQIQGDAADDEFGDNDDDDDIKSNKNIQDYSSNVVKESPEKIFKMRPAYNLFDPLICLREIKLFKNKFRKIHDYCVIERFSIYFPHNNFEDILIDYKIAQHYARINLAAEEERKQMEVAENKYTTRCNYIENCITTDNGENEKLMV